MSVAAFELGFCGILSVESSPPPAQAIFHLFLRYLETPGWALGRTLEFVEMEVMSWEREK